MSWTNTQMPTEFAGQYKMVIINCDPDSATTTIDLTGKLKVIKGVTVGFIGDAIANCYTISTSWNGLTLTVKLWKAGGTAADSTYIDLTVAVYGTM